MKEVTWNGAGNGNVTVRRRVPTAMSVVVVCYPRRWRWIVVQLGSDTLPHQRHNCHSKGWITPVRAVKSIFDIQPSRIGRRRPRLANIEPGRRRSCRMKRICAMVAIGADDAVQWLTQFDAQMLCLINVCIGQRRPKSPSKDKSLSAKSDLEVQSC